MHLLVFNAFVLALGIIANLIAIKNGSFRPGFLTVAISAVFSIWFLFHKKYQYALNITLIFSLLGITIGWLFGTRGVNQGFSIPTIIILFLYFSDITKTILVSVYCLGLLLIRSFWLKSQSPLPEASFTDTLFLFLLFTTISIMTVRILHGYVQEKDELIKEIHHRVRNNLQVLSGLADIHRDSSAVASGHQPYLDFQNRIIAISEVHNCLYKTENYREIDFSQIIREISSNLSEKYGKGIVEVVEPQRKIFLPIESAVPCAMIANELISNAIRHGSDRSNNARVSVEIQKEGGLYRLSVVDWGAGMSDDRLWQNPTTTGFTLIQILTKQLKASLKILKDNGTKAILEFS
ncbi:histidine kinase [Leptospira inadai serovar Lyme str. 10]|uniref:histidine kinase n=1 Tax=Leptospira inadai serovar Lyme str. 10 TaxID=1049790 RepID=V6HVN0_9LEPT|nr:sensor histidine kinase [Leptospira inadai]EQA36919.1 histidine kinase [Leptospira inadai serovar Lyme str. 10]